MVWCEECHVFQVPLTQSGGLCPKLVNTEFGYVLSKDSPFFSIASCFTSIRQLLQVWVFTSSIVAEHIFLCGMSIFGSSG